MKLNPWTVALVSAGIVSLPAAVRADEKIVAVQTALASTTLSGYVDTSAQWNPGTGNGNLPPIPFNGPSKADGFNLNVVKVALEKPLDAADVWSAGYKFEMLAGPDANPFNSQSPLSTGKSDFAVKQAYVALHAPIGNGLDLKLGAWDTIMGYEVFDSVSNPNFTRSYGFAMEPITHTGLLATYNLSENLSVNLGIANTFGSPIDERAQGPNSSASTRAESWKTYMGSFTYTVSTNCGWAAGSTLTACVMNGFNSSMLGGLGADETSYYVGGTLNTPVKGLSVGAAFDYMDVHHTSGETWVAGGYIGYHATEKLSFFGRAEYVRDRGDQKVFTKTITDSVTGDTVVIPAAPDKVLELTGTVQYDLWKNVISRLEVRWDHSLSGQGIWGGSPITVADGEFAGGGDQKNAVVLIANLIYKF